MQHKSALVLDCYKIEANDNDKPPSLRADYQDYLQYTDSILRRVSAFLFRIVGDFTEFGCTKFTIFIFIFIFLSLFLFLFLSYSYSYSWLSPILLTPVSSSGLLRNLPQVPGLTSMDRQYTPRSLGALP